MPVIKDLAKLNDPRATRLERSDAIARLIHHLEGIRQELAIEDRIERARATAGQRLKPDDHHYGVHMTHCYQGDEEFGCPEWCKYGEDETCPAAMYADPRGEYLKIDP